jgi:ATP-binding cassette subfamily C protein
LSSHESDADESANLPSHVDLSPANGFKIVQTLFKLFFDAKRSTSWAVIACLLVASAVEGIGITSVVPLLTLATGMEGSKASPIMIYTRDLMDTLGLPMSIGILLAFFISTMILVSLLNFLAMAYVGSAVAEFSTKLRLQIIKNIFNVQWSYFVHNPIGKITVAVGGQAESTSEAYRLVASMFAGAIQSLVYMIVALTVSWPLALAAVAIGIFVVGSLHVLVRVARKAGMRLNKYGRELSIFLTDTLINIKPLRAMTRQTTFSHLLERKANSLKKAMRRNIISKEGLKNSQEILVTLILGIGFYLAIVVWHVPVIDLAVVGVLLKKPQTTSPNYSAATRTRLAWSGHTSRSGNLSAKRQPCPRKTPARWRRAWKRDANCATCNSVTTARKCCIRSRWKYPRAASPS